MVVEYEKEQILASEKYKRQRDLVDALLEPGKKYTVKSIDNLIKTYLKGQVK